MYQRCLCKIVCRSNFQPTIKKTQKTTKKIFKKVNPTIWSVSPYPNKTTKIPSCNKNYSPQIHSALYTHLNVIEYKLVIPRRTEMLIISKIRSQKSHKEKALRFAVEFVQSSWALRLIEDYL